LSGGKLVETSATTALKKGNGPRVKGAGSARKPSVDSIVYSPSLGKATVDSYFSGPTITTTIYVPINHYSIFPVLSNGTLTLNTKDGLIYGTPSKAETTRLYLITGYSRSGLAIAKAKFVLTIQPAPFNPLGQVGPGGGTVFYYSPVAFAEPGATCGSNCHYLEEAPNTWFGRNLDPQLPWSSDPNLATGATGTDIGTGFSNTQKMLTSGKYYRADTSGAADAVSNFAGTDGSKGQWFLPSKDELNAMWKYQDDLNLGFKKEVSTFRDFWDYWSSTEDSGESPCVLVGSPVACDPSMPVYVEYAWAQGLVNTDGLQGTDSKSTNDTLYVRPIRAF